MEIIGIDVGFGFTKAYNGENSVIFKSIIGDVTDIQFRSLLGDESSTSSLHVTLDGKSYFLGSYAELQSNIKEFTLNQEKLLEDFVKLLAITAVGLCTDSAGPINIVSGLPVGYLKRDTKKFKEMIKGTHEITYHNQNGKDITKKITIDKIHIIPQPIGSIFNLIFDDHGKIKNKALAKQKLGVVDIGFKTSDFSIFDRLQYIERGSSTMNSGISKCFAAIANKLRQESNISIELYRMYQFIESGMIKIKGNEYNITNLKKRVYSQSSSAIAADVNRLWESDWDIDTIILSGGGSVELSEYLVSNIDGNVIPIGKDIDARYNNVYGYCKFGRYKWGYRKFISDQNEGEQSTVESAATDTEGKVSREEDENKSKPSKGLSWLRRQNKN